jgi:hypothetical protein
MFLPWYEDRKRLPLISAMETWADALVARTAQAARAVLRVENILPLFVCYVHPRDGELHKMDV